MNVLQPGTALLCKLASIAIHAEEYISLDGHTLDREALQAVLNDPDVKAWLASMTSMALAPQKRQS